MFVIAGTIRVNQPLDRETVDSYDLVVYATDMSVEGRRSTSVGQTYKEKVPNFIV